MFNGRTILITGGTGSFGEGFVRFLLNSYEPKKVIVFSRDEFKQYKMRQRYSDERLRFFLGDVRDLGRLQRAFHGVDFVVHAAALKQVPALEYNPFEAVQTNIIGSQNVINAAIDQGVLKTLLISTDKAANPSSLYGASKLCAEKLFVSGNFYTDGKSIFGAVRFGNFIMSHGSVVESLREQKKKGEIHITDKRMTRFWITKEELCTTVNFALEHMEGGEIFIPKMPSMKITEIFNALSARASSKTIGIRPGEKLHELLFTENEAPYVIELEKYFVLLPSFSTEFLTRNYDKYKKMGKIFAGGSDFSSEKNTSWLNKKQFLHLLDL